MRSFAWKTLLAGALIMISATALADMNPFGAMGLPLNKADYQEIAKAADPLLNDDSLPLGTKRDWANPKSGNQGTITLMDRLEKPYQGKNLPCRKLEYHVVTAQPGGPYNVVIDRCKAADGTWKIY